MPRVSKPSPTRTEYPHPERVPKLQACQHIRNPAGPFADLPWLQQQAAQQWLYKFCQRWGSDLPSWRRAILIGVSRRLARRPPAPGFGRKLQGAWGGQVAARKYRLAGIPDTRLDGARDMAKWKKAGRPALPSRQLEI